MTNQGWRAELAALVAAAVEDHGGAVVLAALTEEAGGIAPADVAAEVWCPPVPVLAATDCDAGRLAVLLNSDGRVSVHLARTPEGLLELVRESAEEGFLLAVEGTGGPLDREQLREAGIVAPAWFSGSGFSEDELLRACTDLLSLR